MKHSKTVMMMKWQWTMVRHYKYNNNTHFTYVITPPTGAPTNVSLKTILAFFTGADCIPPLRYATATLTFNPTNPYPTASTCAIQLTLPTKYESFQDFKEHMDTTFKMHGGFGLV